MLSDMLSKTNKAMAWLCGLLMVVMMMLLVLDCGSRIADAPLAGMSELSVFVLIVVTYLGLAGGEELGQHVRVEAALNKLPLRMRRVVEWMVSVLEICTVGLFLVAVWINALKSFRTGEAVTGAIQLPLWPVKWIMVAGLVLYLLQVAIKIGRNFKSMTHASK